MNQKHASKKLRDDQPPYNNMGALITAPVIPPNNQVLIDWFAFTVKELDPRAAIKQVGLEKLDFTETSGGGMGYRKTLRSGNIVVFYDGADNMGCHISMTGQGCRQFEAVYQTANRWLCFWITLLSLDATICRIDLAIDNVDGALDLKRLEQCIADKQIKSRFKNGHKIENFSLSPSEEKKQGKTIYIGAPSSRLKIRFYDKAAQLELDGHWTRAELQCRSERAQQAIKHLLSGVTVGALTASVLNQYFLPINLDDSNRSRCSTQSWWTDWLSTVEKIKLTTMKAVKMIEEVIYHVKRQYSASFAMIKKFMGVPNFHDFITEMITEGKEKLTKKHEMIIACSRLVTEPLTNHDAYPF